MEWEEVDPGRKKREIRPRETTRRGCGTRHFCHLAIVGAGARPRPGPARRGESPAAAAPPHALPRRPRARGRPGQVAAVPGSGWPGAAASEHGGGQRRIVVRLGPARSGRAGRAVLGLGSPVRIHSLRFLRCVSASFSALAERAQRPRAGGEPGWSRAPSLPATSPSQRWRGAGGSPRRAPGGGEGAAPACADDGGPAGGGKGTKAGGGRGGPARGRGGGAPPGRS